MATNETWIIFKADSANAPDWENRKLPSGGLTEILAEEWDWSGQLPQVGDRVRDYANLANPGNGITHGKDGDWVVSEVQEFASPATEMKIVVCVCSYQPVDPQWQEINRGAPINDAMLAKVGQ